MAGIDRRTFLHGTGVLAVGALTAKVPAYAVEPQSGTKIAAKDAAAPPPVLEAPAFEAFVWEAPGQVFSFDFFGRKLRARTLLPEGVAVPTWIPESTPVSGLESSMQCTGEDPNDHHGLKATGGTPGIRLEYPHFVRTTPFSNWFGHD